ncbi:MAG: helix-hairpin-helix domain-containing protein [Candidatus Heimdallarchaeota archaeon]
MFKKIAKRKEQTLSVTNLRDIRGIGPSVADRLVAAFGSEAAVLLALRESRIAELSAIEGIGEKFALSLCRNLHFQETGEDIRNFLKTEDAIRIYNQTIEIIAKFANTLYSRSKLYLYFPLPISAHDKIRNRQNVADRGIQLASLIGASPHSFKEYDTLLRNLAPLKEQKTRLDTASRLIVTPDKDLFNDLSTSDVGYHCEVTLIDDIERISDYTKGYDEIIWIGSDILLDDSLPNVVTVAESARNDLVQIVPEKTLGFFARNKRTLESIAGLSHLLQTLPSSALSVYIENLDLEMLREMGEQLGNLEESGEPTSDLNVEYSRLLRAETLFEAKLDEVLIGLNEALEKKLQQSTVELGGEKILALIKGMSSEDPQYAPESGRTNLREYLDDELFMAVEEIINKAEESLIKALDLQDEEIEYLVGIFPRELRYPVDPVEDIVFRLTTYLRQRRAIKSFELKTRLAKTLKQYENIAKQALNYMLELDYLFMLGKFASEYQLILPQLGESPKTGLLIKNGRNLFLTQQELQGGAKVQPVSYAVGEVGRIDGVVSGERIVLLSGANSGGKTTLIVSLAVMVILGQMGLPIPCEKALLGGFKELHYYRKAAGQMDAGAFETTLQTLSQMIMSPHSRLVLADEMESISEPGASARVIAAFLDLLGRSPHSVGIFVTHLAQEIAKYSKEPLRIDGIEAQGLSEDLELLVDRTPVYYQYAASTPELIVRRLFAKSSGEEKTIYSYILDAFESST